MELKTYDNAAVIKQSLAFALMEIACLSAAPWWLDRSK